MWNGCLFDVRWSNVLNCTVCLCCARAELFVKKASDLDLACRHIVVIHIAIVFQFSLYRYVYMSVPCYVSSV